VSRLISITIRSCAITNGPLVLPANSLCQSLFVLVMTNDGEFRLHRLEDAPSVFSRCNRSRNLWALGAGQPSDMNQAVRALREVDKVLRKLGVARDDYRMSSIVDPIAKRRFHRAMVNEKSGYSKETANINVALFDFLGVDLYSFGRQVLSMFSSLDVKLVCSRKMLGHLTRSGGPPNPEWVVASEKPSGEP
jgi:hypothetical protein